MCGRGRSRQLFREREQVGPGGLEVKAGVGDALAIGEWARQSPSLIR